MPRYTVTEPHPTVPQDSYMHSGRGGAGNMFRAPPTTPAAGVPTLPTTSASSSTRFYSGRGGAGNSHFTAERPVLSFDKEFATREKASSSGHVGRGGAGNVTGGAAAVKERKHSDASSDRRDSASTNGSERSGFWGRLSHS